jgi:cyclopropane fatty-acyl-phospholipid synthase-like methyltransferase
MIMDQKMYTSGEYLEKNPNWHVDESPWKAKQVILMTTRNHVVPKTICEVGCGAGEVLRQLQGQMDKECLFWGYDISPQAFELSSGRANERLHFKQLDIRHEQEVFFDLMLVLDVVEHVEDYYSFLREIRPKGQYKMLHIPLDLSVQTILRHNGLLKVRESYGHLHYFTKEIALQAVKDSGYEVLDWSYTARAIELPSDEFNRRLLRLPRKLLFALLRDLAVRILGGWSLLILAK